jgi:beta-lactamase regulating signal transducer with metallopeptidase domain
MNELLQRVAVWTWQNSFAAGALAAAVMGMRRIFRGGIAPHWLCLAGWLVMVRLLLPAPLPHTWAWDRSWAAFAPRPANQQAGESSPNDAAATEGAEQGSLAQLRAEVAAARAALAGMRESGFAQTHPDVLAAGSELVTREQALAAMPAVAAGDPVDWLGIAAWLWLTGALGGACCLFIRHGRFMRRVARTSKPLILTWSGLMDECAAAARLRKAPRLFTIPGSGTPFLCGLFRPRIILPAETLATLSACEARHVLLHEMMHIARRDLAANWLLAALRVLHWFNPLVHAACRRLLADRELLRDRQALRCLTDPAQRRAYGHTLLKLALPLPAPAPSPGLAPLFHSEKELKRRLTMIQSPLHPRRLLAGAASVALALVCVPLFTTAHGEDRAEPEKSTAPPDKPAPSVSVPATATAAPEAPAAAPEPRESDEGFRKLAGQLSVLQSLKGDELILHAMALGASNTVTQLYPAYQTEITSLASALRSGFGPKHPRIRALKESSGSKHRQLVAAAESYKQGLAIQIAAANGGEENAEKKLPASTTSPAAEGTETKSAAPTSDASRIAALENLRSVAAKLREKGQTDEAAAIEKTLASLTTPAPPPPASEMQQLRAEMAEIKAALNGMRHQTAAAEIARLEAEQLRAQKQGYGAKHPFRIEQLARMEAMKRLLGDAADKAGSSDDALQNSLKLLESNAEAMKSYKNAKDQFDKAAAQAEAAGKTLDDVRKASAYELRNELRKYDTGKDADKLKKAVDPKDADSIYKLKKTDQPSDDADRKRKPKEMKEAPEKEDPKKLEFLKKELEAVDRDYDGKRKALEKLKQAADQKDAPKVEVPAAEARRAEPLKAPKEAVGENLPWGVLVPGKTGLVYSPFSPRPAIVDVGGFKGGETVKCPFTGHAFRVPE